jgi:hypothetical protein
VSAPLQNRVTPFGDILATAARGTLMGNRGGRLHDEHRRLGSRRWTSKRWICCELAFKGRRRTVMAPDSYTELFFLDEVTALAAGHRPCFECRRVDARAFADAFPGEDSSADTMDAVLHGERLKRHDVETTADLPDGAVWAESEAAYARRRGQVLRWSFEGWLPAPSWTDGPARLLTPPSIVAVLRRDYEPRWR